MTPTAKKPAAKRAAPDKGAAARAETDPKPKTLKWRGITIELPAELATMRVQVTYRRLQRAAQAEDGGAMLGYIIDLLGHLVGNNESTVDVICDKIDGDELDSFDAVMELQDLVFAQYGVEQGESSASQ